MLHQIMDTYENKTALIIEDDAHSLMALGSILGNMSIRYKRNTTGAEVLQQARRLQPDFILLDMDLPHGDPFLILAALRTDTDLNAVPVIAMGDHHLINHLMPRIRQDSFTGYIPKPFAYQDFENLLKSVLD